MEIERKFLVGPKDVPTSAMTVQHIRQGYIPTEDPESFCVRVRLVRYEGETLTRAAQLTVKAPVTERTRHEFTYPMTVDDAEVLYARCPHRLEKERLHVLVGKHAWDVDVFRERHVGLVLAEVELESEDEEFERPDWLGREVTGDPMFLNQTLARTGVVPLPARPPVPSFGSEWAPYERALQDMFEEEDRRCLETLRQGV